jgi:hypothetical protein
VATELAENDDRVRLIAETLHKTIVEQMTKQAKTKETRTAIEIEAKLGVVNFHDLREPN